MPRDYDLVEEGMAPGEDFDEYGTLVNLLISEYKLPPEAARQFATRVLNTQTNPTSQRIMARGGEVVRAWPASPPKEQIPDKIYGAPLSDAKLSEMQQYAQLMKAEQKADPARGMATGRRATNPVTPIQR